MTDEEMAEQYIQNDAVFVNNKVTIKSVKLAFLAGLKANNEREKEAKSLLARWIDTRPYTVSEQKDLIADTEQFLSEVEN